MTDDPPRDEAEIDNRIDGSSKMLMNGVPCEGQGQRYMGTQ